MDIYITALALGGVGLAGMAVGGLGRHGHSHGDAHGHAGHDGHAHLGHAHGGHHTGHDAGHHAVAHTHGHADAHGAHPHHAHQGGSNPLLSLMSPRLLFSVALGLGTAGILLRSLIPEPVLFALALGTGILFDEETDEGLEQVSLSVRSEDRRRRDAAQEVLLELVPARWRDPVLALLEPGAVVSSYLPEGLGPSPTPESFVAALLDQRSEVVRLLTPCLAREQGWTGVVTRLRAGPRCSDAESAATVDRALDQLERGTEVVHA